MVRTITADQVHIRPTMWSYGLGVVIDLGPERSLEVERRMREMAAAGRYLRTWDAWEDLGEGYFAARCPITDLCVEVGDIEADLPTSSRIFGLRVTVDPSYDLDYTTEPTTLDLDSRLLAATALRRVLAEESNP